MHKPSLPRPQFDFARTPGLGNPLDLPGRAIGHSLGVPKSRSLIPVALAKSTIGAASSQRLDEAHTESALDAPCSFCGHAGRTSGWSRDAGAIQDR